MNKIVVGPDRGLSTTVLPFNVDNNSFPVLINAYQWRKRVKRKRGTSLLGRLNRFFNSLSKVYSPFSTFVLNSGVTSVLSVYNLETNASLVPGQGVYFSQTNSQTYRDLFGNGYLFPGGTGGPNTINYNTGVLTIPAENGSTFRVNFLYQPDLPVMGIRELFLGPNSFSGTLAFDTTYSYNILRTAPYSIYDVSFYKNPADAAYSGYIAKTTWTPVRWNGQNYQQFWTTNFQNALWATNGLQVPFNPGAVGMQFANAASITYISNTSTTITLTITGSPLVVGDFVFLNEWAGTNAITLNFQSGYVTSASGGGSNTVVITLPNANVGAGPYSPGIVQYLTNVSNGALDTLRWYDGDPTNGVVNPPAFMNGLGWVNFMPPLSRASFSISDTPQAQYYLVGARLIYPFKDRLLFLGPVIQTSTGNPIYLPDTVVYSQNGTPFYTASFTGDPSLATTVYNPILVPNNQTATASAYWEDQTGFGGAIALGIDRPLLTCDAVEDVLIVGVPTGEVRVIYTGNDIVPFNFYFIDQELGTSSTFSAVNMGSSVFSRGDRGIVSTTQRICERIDLDILDQNMQINLVGNGAERITAQRDFVNEWIYLTYKSNQNSYTYPTQTLLYNYRDDSWGIFNEAYTTYGQFRKITGNTWATIGSVYPKWSAWNVPWNAGSSTLLAPQVIAGNQQGFILFRDQGTGEASSLYIQAYSSGVITAPDHCLNEGDYIVINSANGITGLNGNIFSVASPIDNNTFTLNPLPTTSGTYLGGGLIQRMYIPFIQTKQFPTAWGLGRKTRIRSTEISIYNYSKRSNPIIDLFKPVCKQSF